MRHFHFGMKDLVYNSWNFNLHFPFKVIAFHFLESLPIQGDDRLFFSKLRMFRMSFKNVSLLFRYGDLVFELRDCYFKAENCISINLMLIPHLQIRTLLLFLATISRCVIGEQVSIYGNLLCLTQETQKYWLLFSLFQLLAMSTKAPKKWSSSVT